LFHALHETAATTLSWALHLLAQHPELQAELQAELNTVLAGRAPTAIDLPELAYTEMVLRETMRLFPPAWLVCRQTRRETRIGDFFLPAGSTVLCSPYIMQRSPRNFVEPQKFLPERFSASFEKRMRRHAYAPFGTDARLEGAPLLAEMKLLLAVIASRFNVSTADNQSVDIDARLSLRPKGGLRLQFTACSGERPAAQTG
jgi:cytochrome P450